MKSKNNILLYREFHRARLFLYKQQKKFSMVKVTRFLFSWKDAVNVISKDWVETGKGDEGSFGALSSFPLSFTIWPRLFKLCTDKSLRSEWAAQENQLRYQLDSDFKLLSSG